MKVKDANDPNFPDVSTYLFFLKEIIFFHSNPSLEYECMLILHAYFKQGASNHNLNMKYSILNLEFL